MRIYHAAAIATSALALTACMTTTSGSASGETKAEPKATASKAAAKPAGLTAKQAAAKLAKATGVTDLGTVTDNTATCSNKALGKKAHANDCTQLITTDTVSIYEFEKPATAAHWVKEMKTRGDWRQVNRFALAWTARGQDMTSDERRAELVKALEKATANEP
ncbi:hypothetical protein [Streptomyces cyslabdanicus]|uniref:hypothetical protein n=1 Tax=Streptomyces cyslabdanicus TaxID=1470456 RepID=UPI00404513B3